MRKTRQMTLEELVHENREELMNDKEALEQLETRLDERHSEAL